MIFAGLPLLQWLGILGGAAAFATALYILKLRRRAVAVPFSKLWERILRDKEATSLFSKLKRLLSLLLQIALLALLAISLGDPRAAATLIKGRNLVVLVDASASMKATDVAPNRLGVAKDEVKKLIRGLGGSDRMLIAQMDASITPTGPMSGDTSDLERATIRFKRPTRAPIFRAPSASRPTRSVASKMQKSLWFRMVRSAPRPTPPAPCTSATRSSRTSRSARARATSPSPRSRSEGTRSTRAATR